MLSDRILFVDDEPKARLHTLVTLDTFGLQIDVASGLAAARRLCERHGYGVVVVSSQDAAATLEIVAELQAGQPDAVYAVLTSDAELIVHAVNNFGVSAVIPRTCDAFELAAQLGRCLELHLERHGRPEIDARVATLHRGIRQQQGILEQSLGSVLDRRPDQDSAELLRQMREAQDQLLGSSRRFYQELAELERTIGNESSARRRLRGVASRVEGAALGKAAGVEEAIPVSDSELREHERVPLVTDVTLESNGAEQYGTSENVSEGGLFIATEAPYKTGERLGVSFVVPGGDRIHVTAEIAWCRVRQTGPGAKPSGVGVRFLDLGAEHRGWIARFIELWSNEGLARLERLAM
jgi:uncharacterized protein (TIGR02266 family)